jgi:HSP20 family protein
MVDHTGPDRAWKDLFESVDLYQAGAFPSQSNRWAVRPYAWRPPTDVYELDQTIMVRVEIAGMRESDFSILIQDRNLIIRGIRVDMPERRAYHQMEIRYGEFLTEVELPAPVVVEEAHAEYQSGFLTIVLPKLKARNIQIADI